jgi:uncharacterized protein YegP (UPF0339 family)
MWFEIYEDSCRKTTERWRWRLREQDQVVAASTAGYADETACRNAIASLRELPLETPMKTRERSRKRPKPASLPPPVPLGEAPQRYGGRPSLVLVRSPKG